VQDLPSHLEFKLLWHPVRPLNDSNEKIKPGSIRGKPNKDRPWC